MASRGRLEIPDGHIVTFFARGLNETEKAAFWGFALQWIRGRGGLRRRAGRWRENSRDLRVDEARHKQAINENQNQPECATEKHGSCSEDHIILAVGPAQLKAWQRRGRQDDPDAAAGGIGRSYPRCNRRRQHDAAHRRPSPHKTRALYPLSANRTQRAPQGNGSSARNPR